MTGVTAFNANVIVSRYNTAAGLTPAARARNRFNEYDLVAREKRLTPADRIARIEALERRSALRYPEKKPAAAQPDKADKMLAGVKRVCRNGRRFPAVSVLMTLAFACILTLVVYSSVQLSEATRDLNTLRAGINKQNAEITLMESSLSAKTDLNAVEDYAVNELGMIKKNKADSEYISVRPGDSVEMLDGAGEAANADTSLLSAFSERIRSLLEYFN